MGGCLFIGADAACVLRIAAEMPTLTTFFVTYNVMIPTTYFLSQKTEYLSLHRLQHR